MSLNFTYYPLVYRAGREGVAIPGMQVLDAPRLAQRHRQGDLLALLLSLSGDHRYDPEEIQVFTREAALAFFQMQGSVTRAMQAVAENLNKQLYDRNLDRAYEGVHALGSLNLAVMHKDWLFIAQFGRGQAIFINNEMVNILGESVDTGDFLGLSRRIQVRFAQAELRPDDLLLLNAQLPPSWTVANLAGSASLSMTQVKRRLLSQVTDTLEALVIKFPAGNGKVTAGDWAQLSPPAAPDHKPEPDEQPETVEEAQSAFGESVLPHSSTPQTFEPSPETQTFDQDDGHASDEPPDLDDLTAAPAQPFSSEGAGAHDEPFPQPSETHGQEAQEIDVLPGETEQPSADGNGSSVSAPLLARRQPLLSGLARVWLKLGAWHQSFRQGIAKITGRFQHERYPSQPGIPSLFMLILSLAIPLVLILASVTVYTQSGKTEAFQALFEEAQLSAQSAAKEKNVTQQRAYWAQALDLVTQAQQYSLTQESQALFQLAQSTLDEMDLAGRLDFRPALTQFFSEEVVLSRILSSSSGIYLLDETSGSVLRIFLNSKGFYELDAEFLCAPGPYGLTTVSRLVDFVALPANKDNYRVMALDQAGNLIYCRPGDFPVSLTLPAPTGGIKRIIGVALENDVLFVLDADKDAIWMYEGQDRVKENVTGVYFSKSPIKYLDEDVPDLGGALDMIVNREDMYILHADGHMTLCRYSAYKDVKLTECQDPAPYSDSRVGRERKPWIFLDSQLHMMQQTNMPNAALYVLDIQNRSINQFSYQLNLERVFKPQINRNFPLPDLAPSGFGITSDMEVFLSFNNQLYIAPLR